MIPDSPNFAKLNGLVPCIVQDSSTLKVLMLGFMNKQAWEQTLTERRVTFYSRSRKQVWTKGETSGHYLNVVQITLDCDGDTVLIHANPTGPVCHTGADTCFKESNEGPITLAWLEQIIQRRKDSPNSGSYTSGLFQRGINRIAQKVGEEAVELVIEAKENDREKLLNEAADLVYHLLVLLAAKDTSLNDVVGVLRQRSTGI